MVVIPARKVKIERAPRKGRGLNGRLRHAFVIARMAGAMTAAALTATGCGARAPAPSASATAGADIGGPFTLTDQNGKAVNQHILDGHWSAVFFGYTFCPDTCPATLQALGAASRLLHDKGKSFQTVFVSVDPGRDTAAAMKTYLESQGFPAHAVGLVGTPAQTAAVARAYSVYYAKEGSGPDYTMDHSAAIYLMDPKGRFNRPLAHGMAPQLIASQIEAAESGA